MQLASFGKSTYFITFIDDFTRIYWVYFISSKYEALKRFKEFKLLVEKQSEHSVKCLRSDRGGEYCSNEFFQFCKENGIRRHLTSPYTPQQNGVAERKNHTLFDMVRSMMCFTDLPISF